MALDFVKELLVSIPEPHIEKVRLSPEAAELADKYIEAKVVGKKAVQTVNILPF